MGKKDQGEIVWSAQWVGAPCCGCRCTMCHSGNCCQLPPEEER